MATSSDLSQKVVYLPFDRSHVYLRVQQAGWAHHLFYKRLFAFKLIGAGRSGNVYHPMYSIFKFVEAQRAVVLGRGQAEAVFYQFLLAGTVPLVHAPHLGHGNVGLVYHHQEIIGEII